MTSEENRKVWETLKRWKGDPVAFVRENFNVEPDAWQVEALRAFPSNNRLAMKACKGPGKTAVLAWMILNFLATRPHPKVGCTSITGDNLATNLWPELATWLNKSAFLSATFSWTKTRVEHRHHPETWFAVARSWPKTGSAEQQADALAGLHADYAMFVLDESGGIPQAVMVTAEAVLLSGIETKVVQAGNPTHTTGPLYRACTIDRASWYVVTITGDPDDPARSPRINIDEARKAIASYGRDNPWVMVNILGQFPPASINALLGVEEVQAAMKRKIPVTAYEFAQKRLGVDVARYGDDRTVIFPRQGKRAFKPVEMRHERGSSVSNDIAARVAEATMRWGSEICFVDDTVGWAHGVLDNLQLMPGMSPAIPVNFAGKALDPRYKNKRAEIWMKMAEWVRAGGCLPDIPEMIPELTEVTYTFVGGQFMIEDKDQIKEKIGKSPDLADALALTFSMVDMPGQMHIPGVLKFAQTVKHDVDPYEEQPGPGTGRVRTGDDDEMMTLEEWRMAA